MSKINYIPFEFTTDDYAAVKQAVEEDYASRNISLKAEPSIIANKEKQFVYYDVINPKLINDPNLVLVTTLELDTNKQLKTLYTEIKNAITRIVGGIEESVAKINPDGFNEHGVDEEIDGQISKKSKRNNPLWGPDRIVYRETWEDLAEVADTHRGFKESRAVVARSFSGEATPICVNARACAEWIKANWNDGFTQEFVDHCSTEVYNACENKKNYRHHVYKGYIWNYATRIEIEQIILTRYDLPSVDVASMDDTKPSDPVSSEFDKEYSQTDFEKGNFINNFTN